MRLSRILAFTTAAVLLYACGGSSSLGSGNGSDPLGNTGGSSGSGNGDSGATGGSGGSSGGGYEPCAGKPCGATCNLCDPKDTDCVEDRSVKYCDEQGTCHTGGFPGCPPPTGCSDDSECAVDLGPCSVCPDGSYACPGAACIGGQCVGYFEGCKGGECTSDAECPVSLAPCQLCPDGSAACPYSRCVGGQCQTGFDSCGGYEPCAGKGCGDECSLCDPTDPECAETAVLKYCDDQGSCGPAYPACGIGGNQCIDASDCPGIGACQRCPGDTCAEMQCVKGQCELACPPGGEPECTRASDCIVPDICKHCPDGSCAHTECILGSCEFVCGL